MKKLLCSLKQNINYKNKKILKFYLLIFSLLNLIYVCLEIYNLKLRESFSSLGNSFPLIKETYPSEFIISTNISKANNIIVYIIFCINLFCFIMLINKKFNINAKQFLIIHIVFLFLASLISYILAAIFLVPIGNLIEQLFTSYLITFIVSIYFIVKTVYRKIKSFIN